MDIRAHKFLRVKTWAEMEEQDRAGRAKLGQSKASSSSDLPGSKVAVSEAKAKLLERVLAETAEKKKEREPTSPTSIAESELAGREAEPASSPKGSNINPITAPEAYSKCTEVTLKSPPSVPSYSSNQSSDIRYRTIVPPDPIWFVIPGWNIGGSWRSHAASSVLRFSDSDEWGWIAWSIFKRPFLMEVIKRT